MWSLSIRCRVSLAVSSPASAEPSFSENKFASETGLHKRKFNFWHLSSLHASKTIKPSKELRLFIAQLPSYHSCLLVKTWATSTLACNQSASNVMSGKQSLQKVFTPLDFFHILLCHSLNLKCITLRFCVTGLHTIPHNVKVDYIFFYIYKWMKTEKLNKF